MSRFRIAISLILSASAGWAQDVDQIVRRIQELVPRESLSLGIETELRAASLLRESRPELAAAFLKNGERGIASHPEIEPTKWMVSSLLTLEPERGEEAILKLAKPGSFDSLLQYYFTSNQSDRGAAVLQKALCDGGPPVPYVAKAMQKLILLDPVAAADTYFSLKDSPKLASKYVAGMNRAPVVFSQGLANAAAINPKAVRSVLARLLPLFDDEKFLANVRMDASITTRIGGEEVATKSSRETVLLRLGALARAIDPELYQRNQKRFDARLRSVKTLDDARAIADARTETNSHEKPGFDFAKGPVEAAFAEWRKLEFNPRLYNATGALLDRADLSPAQKEAVMDEMIAGIRVAEKQDQAPAADQLIWFASKAGLDRETIRPAVELLVNHVRDARYPLYDGAAVMIREYGLSLGEYDPSIQARIALAQLEEALSDHYNFTLPSLDGESVRLKDLRGKVVMLNFWATWCGPCRAEEPILENVYRALKDKGFMLLAITDEDPAIVRRFAKQFKIDLPILIDRARSVFHHYAVEGRPVTVILNRQGRLAARPPMISDEEGLRKLLVSAGITP